MVLFSFSINNHIDLIKQGLKTQTTRIPRKLQKHGNPAYKVGDNVQLYHRSRQKKSCANCISVCKVNSFRESKEYLGNYPPCDKWSNFFGESEIIDIIHYHNGDYKESGHETWMGYPLAYADAQNKSSWAHADGFPSWNDANEWFKASTENELWDYKDLDVIVWRADLISDRWRKNAIY